MDINVDNTIDDRNGHNTEDFGSAELEIDLLSRRTSSQSDDNSIFAQLDANDTLFGDLADDCDDNLPPIMSDSSKAVTLEPIVSINPIRLPFESSLLAQTGLGVKTQSSLTISPIPPIPSKRGPGRPRKDGKVPIQRKNLFPGRPRMRGRKTLNVLGVGSNPSGTDIPITKPTSSISSFNIGSGLSIKAVSSNSMPRMPLDSGRVELTISSGTFGSQMNSNLSISDSNDSNLEIESKYSTKVCIFCNLSENSSLSLGELIRCEPTPGFSPFKRTARPKRSTEDSDPMASNSSSIDKTELSSPIRTASKELNPKTYRRGTDVQKVIPGPLDELNSIGFNDESSIINLFEPSGHCYAHHCCAAWSEGVRQNDEYVFLNVDKAVCVGAQQRCHHCKRFGATINCQSTTKCSLVYHYACAVISGTFLDIKSLSMLCSMHSNQATVMSKSESLCVSCEKSENISDLLFCTSCGHHYHGLCLDPPVAPTASVRAGWQCPECKICQTCHQPGDDNKMLVCDTCDKGYHIFCLRPIMSTVPKHGWKCKNCRVCGDCGARTPGNGPSSRWHMNYSVCDSCYQQRNKGSSCPICGKAYRQACQNEMLQCMTCRKLIHPKCEPKFSQRNDLIAEIANNYVCKVCETSSASGVSDPRDDFVSAGLPDNIFNASRESFNSFTEDSLGSIDNIDVQPLGADNSMESKPFQTPATNSGISLIRPPVPISGKLSGKKRMSFPGKVRGGKFTGRKRAKIVEFRRKRGPKTKFKPFAGPSSALAMTSSGPTGISSVISGPECEIREKIKDDDPAIENKVVLCSVKDDFVLSQDLCAMCGSLGQSEEGRLISCSQCGQCYHPFCVNIKVTKVVLNKGWRCLECTVCEGCGQPHDEARLLLCDDCDISYHTYCLDPPLAEVPQGTWKCHWCVVCVKCKSTNPGYGSLWQKNYTECGPCASQSICPVCQSDYREQDLIIECIQCNRWLHSKCDGMVTEDECENAADFGYHCPMCRPKDELPLHLQVRKISKQQIMSSMKQNSEELKENVFNKSIIRRDSEDSIASKMSVHSTANQMQVTPTSVPMSSTTPSLTPTNAKSVAPKIQLQYHFVDGVWLSDRGLNQIKTLQLEQPKRTRVKRGSKQALNQLSTPIKTEETDEVNKEDDTGSVEDKVAEDGSVIKTDEMTEKKKRQRRLHKLGIGGFSVKQRGRMSTSKDIEEVITPNLDLDDLNGNQESVGADKPRRKRRASKKKSQLQDSFPQYMQEAFFGKGLLDGFGQPETNQSIGSNSMNVSEDEEVLTKNIGKDKLIVLTPTEIAAVKSQKTKPEPSGSRVIDERSSNSIEDDLQDSEDFQDLLPPLPPDDELMDMLINDEGLDRNDESLDNLSVDEKESDVNPKDDGIDLLSPHFNLDGIVGATSLPQMDSKDVEDLFKGVLSPHNTDDSNDFNAILGPTPVPMTPKNTIPMQIPPPPLTSPLAPPTTQNMMPASAVPLPQLMHSKPPTIDNTTPLPMMDSPYNMPPPSPFPVSALNDNTAAQYSPQIVEPQSPWPSEGDEQMTSQGQKNMIKWESDEALGQMATISPVLYANLSHPNLKAEYPIWNDRIKQISKLWRQLPTDQRQPFLQKARENRAASRIQRAQSETQRSGKEIRPTIPPPVPPIRDTDNERQWKHLQASRQQQQVQQQHVIQEQRQALLKTIGPISPGAADNMRPTLMHSIPQSPSRLGPDYCNESGPQMPPHSQDIPMQTMPTQIQRLPIQAQFAPNMNRPPIQSPSGPSPMSPVIQVSRVRPPIDPNKLPVSSAGCKPMQPYDPYSHSPQTPRPQPQLTLQPIVRPGTPQQRSPFSPSSPGASHPNPSLQPNTGESFQTPPSTPRPLSNDPHSQTSMPSSPYGQPRTPLSSPFSPTHNVMTQNQQCVDSYSMQNTVQRQQSFGSEYQNNSVNNMSDNSQTNECLYQNVGQRMGQRTPDYNQNMSSPNIDPYARPVPTPQPPQSPQSEQMVKIPIPSPNVQTDIYARQPMTPRPQQPIHRSPFDDMYSSHPPTPRMPQQPDMYSQPPGTPRPGFQQQIPHPQQSKPPQQTPHDPYAYQPNTPRPVVTSRPSMPPIRQPVMMRPPPIGPIDPYARQPGTPMPPPLHDPYAKQPSTPMPVSPNERPQEPNDTQLSRQHLRDLLQRRQQGSDMPPRLWTVNNQIRVHPNDGTFRQPIPPGAMGRPRIPSAFPTDQVFRHPASGDQRMLIQRMPDPRMRSVLVPQSQQQFQIRGQQQWVRLPGPTHPNTLVSSQPLAQQQCLDNSQYNQMLPPGMHQMPPPGAPQSPNAVYASQPLRPIRSPVFVRQSHPMQALNVQNNELMQTQSTHTPNSEPNPNPNPTPAQQITEPKVEPKPPTTSDIVKQLQEQQNPELVEEECSVEDLDDDELLGLGNDFNILEYADPELDKALSGKTGGKSNIFDEHLDDLDDKEDNDEKKNKEKSEQKVSEINDKKIDVKEENSSSTQGLNPNNQMPAPLKPINARVSYAPPPPYPGGQQEMSQPLPPPPPYPQSPRQMAPNVVKHNVGQPESVEQHSQLRPPLLQEQPLLLEDLVEQEKRDQRQTMNTRPYMAENIMTQSDPLLSDVEFERLKADILLDEPIHGPVITSIPPNQQTPQQMQTFGQQMQSNPNQPPPHWQTIGDQTYATQPRMPPMGPRMGQSVPRHQMFQTVSINQIGIPSVRMASNIRQMMPNPSQVMPPIRQQLVSLPPPPTPPAEPMNESERQQQLQYESWLIQQNNVLTQQQKVFETEVAKMRKSKKVLTTKQRQCKKNQNQLSDQDQNELTRITQEMSALQKHLDQIRKSVRHHQILSNDYHQKRSKQSMAGVVPQTAISLPQSPGSSSIPSMQTSPRSVHSPLMALGSSGPGTPIALTGPTTPQSPAIMSPSPLGPSPSPLMQNSPVPNMNSPAAMPPSPMVQSPMPHPLSTDSNIRPQIPGQSVHIVDDNNPFSDIYQQKEKMQMTSMRAPTQTASSPYGQQMDERQQMFRQIPFHNDDNMPYHHSVPHQSQPLGQQIRQPMQQMSQSLQTQHTTSHYQQSNETQMFRFPNQQHIHPQRPYTELVGQQYPAQLPPGYQQQQQQQQHSQMAIRRPPPPPYPGSLGQHMSQQSQQQMRMYGSPQVAQMSRLPVHQMHPRMSEFAVRSNANDFESNSFADNISLNSYSNNPEDNQMVQCSPRQTPVSSYSLSDDNLSMHSSAPDMSTIGSEQHLESNSNNDLMNDLQQNDSIDLKPSLVGEAKTSLTFNIDEQGSGQDNDAINDLLINQSNSTKESEEHKQMNTEVKIKTEIIDSNLDSNQSNRWTNDKIEIKAEKDTTYSSSCSVAQHSTTPEESEPMETQDIETNCLQNETKNDINSNDLSNDLNDSDINEDSIHTKQNALLKQLLQNCPSADSQSKAIESIIKENEEQNDSNNSIQVNEETAQTVENIVEQVVDKEPVVYEQLPTVPKQETELQECVESIDAPIPSSEPIMSVPSPALMSTSVSTEKKMSYLDIRRAQLEREPTPPPEEIKPKRKRMTKRKESKSPDMMSGDPIVKPPTKKRSRKASQSVRSDEDSEVFFATLMAQLRALPPLPILEPIIKPNFNVCLPFDVSDLTTKDSGIRGTYGNAFLSSTIDYYSTYPFGPKKAAPLTPSLPACAVNSCNTVTNSVVSASSSSIGMPSTSRGFYNEEFAKTSYLTHNYRNECDFNHYFRDCDSPDTIVSSSSPETVLYDCPTDSFRALKFISADDDEEVKDINNNRSSPDIPLIVSIPVRPIPIMASSLMSDKRISDLDFDKDKENALLDTNNTLKPKTTSAPLRDAGNVGVTLTLSSADDIRGILTALAKYLDIPAPNTFEIVERTTTPPSQKLGLYHQKDTIDSNDNNPNAPNNLNEKMQILKNFCKFCDIVVLNSGIKKKSSELSLSAQEQLEEEEEVMFCSTNCYMQFALSHRGVHNNQDKEAAAVVPHRQSIEMPMNEIKTEKPLIVKHSMDLLPPMSPMMEDDDISDQEMAALNLSPKLPALPINDNTIAPNSHMEVDSENPTPTQSVLSEPIPKKWKELRYKYWNNQSFDKKTKTEEEDDEEEDEAGLDLDKMAICVKHEVNSAEKRKCSLCHDFGDAEPDGPSRLLNMDVDKWVHLNCALWSTEVYEMLNGGLMNVDQACNRAMAIQCSKCQKTGASLRCQKPRCVISYHFPCAIKAQCVFMKDKSVFCSQHSKYSQLQGSEEMTSFVVFRRVFVNREEQKQIASMIHMGDSHLLRIGNLIFVNIGQLLPHQLQAFHSPNCIYPVGYRIIRFYWSWRRFGKRCKYICSIHEVDARPEFVVEIKEEGFENVVFRDRSPKSVWFKILEPIVRMRSEAKSIKVFTEYITGEDLFGLSEPAIVRILESLPGIDTLNDYNFRYGRSPLLELPLAINPTGCARTEPKLRTHFKRPHRLHVSTSNSSRSSIQSSLSGMEITSPYVKQFVHSKSSQYRKMKMEWRNNVYLARSRIQGLGLYAVKDIEKHTMVIEYIGLLIRNEIAERNERIYEAQNRGVYMFRLDDNRVIDATLSGGLARYANHSCDPNCVAESVQIDRENKILIIANRRIQRGEELTYDYKFDVEDDQHKIPCNCGAHNCRKWMN